MLHKWVIVVKIKNANSKWQEKVYVLAEKPIFYGADVL